GRGVDHPQPQGRPVLSEGAGGDFGGRVGHGANIGGGRRGVIRASFLPTPWGGGPRSGGGALPQPNQAAPPSRTLSRPRHLPICMGRRAPALTAASRPAFRE